MAFQELVVPQPPKRPVGRPPVPFSLDIVREIAQFVGDGMTLHAACLMKDTYPCPSLFFEWVNDNAAAKRIWQAGKAAKCEALTQQCLDIADETAADYIAFTSREAQEGGAEVTTVTIEERPQTISRVKMRLAERHRAQTKYLPRDYGEHQSAPVPDVLLPIAAPVTPAASGTIELVKQLDPRGIAYWAAVGERLRDQENEQK